METGIEINSGEVKLQDLLDAYYESRPSHPSRRMGASSIGKACLRYIWLKFHWAVPDKFDGETLRTFDLGHTMEAKMVEDLGEIGFDIRFTGKDQIELEILPHLVCYPDGLIESGVPGAEKTPHAWDNKIMADKYFKLVVKKGLRSARPEYYDQLQLEMYGLSKKLGREIERALITIVNKDTLQVYAERVKYDEDRIQELLAKGEAVRSASLLPPGVSTNPNWMECQMCPVSHFCHVSHESLSVNCRTCCHSTPEEDGTWSCHLDKKYQWGIGNLTPEMQRTGCRCHVFNPSIVPYPMHEDMNGEDSICYELPDGSLVLNGHEGIDSHDLWKVGRPGSEVVEGQDISF